MFLPSSQASISRNSYFTTDTELLTIHKAEPIRAGQTPESHFFFLHWTALGHFSSMRTAAFVLLWVPPQAHSRLADLLYPCINKDGSASSVLLGSLTLGEPPAFPGQELVRARPHGSLSAGGRGPLVDRAQGWLISENKEVDRDISLCLKVRSYSKSGETQTLRMGIKLVLSP